MPAPAHAGAGPSRRGLGRARPRRTRCWTQSAPRRRSAAGKVTPEHERYFALKELADAIGGTLNAYENRLEDRKRSYMEAAQPEATGRRSANTGRSKPKSLRHDDLLRASSRWGHFRQRRAWNQEAMLAELFETSEPLPDDQDLFEVAKPAARLLNLDGDSRFRRYSAGVFVHSRVPRWGALPTPRRDARWSSTTSTRVGHRVWGWKLEGANHCARTDPGRAR